MHDLLGTIRTGQRSHWETGQRILAEVYLNEFPAVRANDELAIDVIYSEVLLREEFGEAISPDEYLERFPQYAAKLRRQLMVHEALRPDSRPAVGEHRGAPKHWGFGTTPPINRSEHGAFAVDSYLDLLGDTDEQLGRTDPLVMNLLVARGISRLGGLDIPRYLARRDRLADAVDAELPNAQRAFERNPS